MKLEDVPVHSLVPAALADISSVSDFMQMLPEYDDDMAQQLAEAEAQDECLRFVGEHTVLQPLVWRILSRRGVTAGCTLTCCLASLPVRAGSGWQGLPHRNTSCPGCIDIAGEGMQCADWVQSGVMANSGCVAGQDYDTVSASSLNWGLCCHAVLAGRV